MGPPSAPCGHDPAPGRAHKDGQAVPPAPTPGYPGPMSPPRFTIVRNMDPELVDAEYTTDDPEEASELIDMAHARRPWSRVTIYDGEGQIPRRVKPRNWVDEAGDRN